MESSEQITWINKVAEAYSVLRLVAVWLSIFYICLSTSFLFPSRGDIIKCSEGDMNRRLTHKAKKMGIWFRGLCEPTFWLFSIWFLAFSITFHSCVLGSVGQYSIIGPAGWTTLLPTGWESIQLVAQALDAPTQVPSWIRNNEETRQRCSRHKIGRHLLFYVYLSVYV